MNWKKVVPSIMVAAAITLTSISGVFGSSAKLASASAPEGLVVDLNDPSKWSKEDGFAPQSGSVTAKDGALEFTRANSENGGSWGVFQYSDISRTSPLKLNTNNITHLLADLSAYNGWDITLQFRNAGSTTADYVPQDELSVSLNSLLHFWATGGVGTGKYAPNIWGEKHNHNYTHQSPISLAELLSVAKAHAGEENAKNFKIDADGMVQLIELRVKIDWVDPGKGLTLRKLELGKADPSMSLTTTGKWNVQPEQAEFAKAASDENGWRFTRIKDGGADSIWFESSYFSRQWPKFIDLDAVGKLDVSMIADNGWNIGMNIRVGTSTKNYWVDVEELHLDLNHYINFKRTGNYAYDLYGDKQEGGQFKLDETIDLKDWIKVTMEHRNGVSGKDFVMPADGVIQIIELRVSPNYFPVNEGIHLKDLTFTTTKNLDNTVKSANIGNHAAKTNGNNISFEISKSNATDGNKFAPTFVLPQGATISPASGTVVDFTTPQIYTVTSEFGLSQEYTVSVALLNDSAMIEHAALENGENDIAGIIDGTNVSFAVKSGYDITAVAPNFTVSAGATISPTEPQDFSKGPVVYTVTPQDGSDPIKYTVSIRVLSNACDITKATINGVDGAIDGNKISFILPPGTDATALTPVFVLSQNATISAQGTADFTAPVVYTVTAEDGTVKEYTVSVTVSKAPTYLNVDLSTKWEHTEGPIGFEKTAYDESKKALILAPNKSGEWANVDNTGFAAPYMIDINAATHLHFDLTAGNGWDIKLLVKANGQEALISVNKFISVRDGLGEGTYYSGTYKDSLAIKDMIKAANPNFNIPANGLVEIHLVRVWVGYHTEIVKDPKDKDAAIVIRYIALDNAKANNTVGEENAVKPVGVVDSYLANLKGDWKATGEGDITMGPVAYNEAKKALVSSAVKGGTWTNVDYQFKYGEKVYLNTAKATHFHFDLTSGNGFDVNVLLVDAEGDKLYLSLNEYLAYQTGRGNNLYYKGTYKDSVELKQWISYIMSLEKNKGSKFNIPANGVVEVVQLRVHVSYLEKGQSAFEVRALAFGDRNATGLGFVPSVYSTEPQNSYVVNLKDEWKATGEGDITMGPVSYDETKKALVSSAVKGGTWTNVDYQFGYKKRIILNTKNATHFHFDLTSGNGFDVNMMLVDAEGDKLYLSLNEYLAYQTGRESQLYYQGTYKDSVDLKQWISYIMSLEKNKGSKFNIPANGTVEVVQLRVHVSYLEDGQSAFEVRGLAFGDKKATGLGMKPVSHNTAPQGAYHANLKGVWKHTEGPIEFGSIAYDKAKKGLYIKPNKAGDWANVDYQFGYKERIILDLDKATHLHFDLDAGNGWDLMFLVKDDKGETLPVYLNKYKSSADGFGYTTHYYTGSYKGKYELRKMIETAIQNNPDTKFKMPANGVIEITQLRVWIGYHGDKDASVVLRRFNFNNENMTNIPNANTAETTGFVAQIALFGVIASGFVLLAIGRKKKRAVK